MTLNHMALKNWHFLKSLKSMILMKEQKLSQKIVRHNGMQL